MRVKGALPPRSRTRMRAAASPISLPPTFRLLPQNSLFRSAAAAAATLVSLHFSETLNPAESESGDLTL